MEYYEIKRKGLTFWCRKGTMDEYICKEVAGGTYKKLEVREGDRLLDIGANIGVMSCLAAYEGATVEAYEPGEENFEVAERNLLRNGLTQSVHLKSYAVVGDYDKTRTFYLNTKKNGGAHSFYVKRGRTEVTVRCKNINSILQSFKPNKIKIDAEGAELEIIQSILPENWEVIDRIIFEYHFAVLKDRDKSKYFGVIETLKRYFKEVRFNEAPGKNWTTIVYARK